MWAESFGDIMAIQKRIVAAPVATRTVAPARAVAPARVATPARVAAPVAPKVSNGFQILKGIDIPAKRAFGKRGIFNDLFLNDPSNGGMEIGDCLEIQVDADKTNISKMNSLYNAARRNGADVTIRVHDGGVDGKTGGVLRMWYNGQKAAV